MKNQKILLAEGPIHWGLLLLESGKWSSAEQESVYWRQFNVASMDTFFWQFRDLYSQNNGNRHSTKGQSSSKILGCTSAFVYTPFTTWQRNWGNIMTTNNISRRWQSWCQRKRYRWWRWITFKIITEANNKVQFNCKGKRPANIVETQLERKARNKRLFWGLPELCCQVDLSFSLCCLPALWPWTRYVPSWSFRYDINNSTRLREIKAEHVDLLVSC